MPQVLSVNGKDYSILKLLGRGKGGYSYLAGLEITTVCKESAFRFLR